MLSGLACRTRPTPPKRQCQNCHAVPSLGNDTKKGEDGMEVVAAGVSVRMIVLFAVAVAGQIGGSLLLGRTEGWTNPLWSALCVAVYAPSFWALATLGACSF